MLYGSLQIISLIYILPTILFKATVLSWENMLNYYNQQGGKFAKSTGGISYEHHTADCKGFYFPVACRLCFGFHSGLPDHE